jgi:hypothetical protein
MFLGLPFFGLAVLASRLNPTLSTKETLLSTFGDHVFGRGSSLYIVLQASTAIILCLSANTSFADFPRLSSIVARDGFLPKQLAHRGDRLVFSNGIIALAVSAGLLLVAFRGQVVALIPLFAVGLFTAFTLSQAGMVRHHLRLRGKRWKVGVAINGIGASATFVVLVVVLVSKFTSGAWIPALVIPVIVVLFNGIKRHYDQIEKVLAVPKGEPLPLFHNTVVVPVSDLNRDTFNALAYAKSLHPERLVAVSVTIDDTDVQKLEQQWSDLGLDIPLVTVESPYRDVTGPVLDFLDSLDRGLPYEVITVVIPEFVVHRWWEEALHNQSALVLKARLLFRPNTVVVSIPVQIE